MLFLARILLLFLSISRAKDLVKIKEMLTIKAIHLAEVIFILRLQALIIRPKMLYMLYRDINIYVYKYGIVSLILMTSLNKMNNYFK